MSLTIKDAKKTYVGPDGSRVPVIDIPSLTLADGEQVALIGTSGSGKTTLLHMIAGILTPDQGELLFQIGTESAVQHRIAQRSRARCLSRAAHRIRLSNASSASRIHRVGECAAWHELHRPAPRSGMGEASAERSRPCAIV